MTRRPAPTRSARAVLLAVTSAALSVAAHGVAGGAVTEFAPALPLSLLVAFAGTGLADRGHRRWAIMATLGVAQVGQHVLLDLGHHPADGPGLGFDPLAMAAAHVIAAVLTGLLLTRADAALHALAVAVARFLPTPPALLVPAGALWSPTPATATNTPVDVVRRRVHGRRGPPGP